MNFLSMKYFLEVEKERSFSKAASKLHITQQTLSAHIASIEKELKCQLFIRRIPLELTYAGKIFLSYAKELDHKYLSMQQEFNQISENRAGLLRIGLSYTRDLFLMPNIIEDFQTTYPNYIIESISDTVEALEDKLLHGEVDLALAAFNHPCELIKLFPFIKEEIILMISKELFISIFGKDYEEVKSNIQKGQCSYLNFVPFIMANPNNISGKLSRMCFDEHEVKPTVKAQSDNIQTCIKLCLKGVGACFCPRNLMESSLSRSKRKQLFIIEPLKNMTYTIYFGVLKTNPQLSIISEFIKIAQESKIRYNKKL